MYQLLVLLLFGCILLSGCAGIAPSPGSPADTNSSIVSTQPSRTAPTPESRADNFAFIFRSRSCGITDENVLDTAKGTLVHTPIGDTTSVTISLKLSNDELDAIYGKVSSTEFFTYPAYLHIPKDEVTGINAPAATYSLSVRNGTQSNTVTWTDDVFEPKRENIERFRELIKLIEQSMNAHPEMHNLPEAKAGYL